MKCEYCGRTIEAKDEVCPGCGAPVDKQKIKQMQLEEKRKERAIKKHKEEMKKQAEKPIRYSPFWRRAVALMIDTTLLFVLITILGQQVYISWEVEKIIEGKVFFIICYVLYSAFCENYWDGGTIGKHICRIHVITQERESITLKVAMVRNMGKVLSGALLGIGFLMALFNKEKCTFHDRMAGTYVICNE